MNSSCFFVRSRDAISANRFSTSPLRSWASFPAEGRFESFREGIRLGVVTTDFVLLDELIISDFSTMALLIHGVAKSSLPPNETNCGCLIVSSPYDTWHY